MTQNNINKFIMIITFTMIFFGVTSINAGAFDEIAVQEKIIDLNKADSSIFKFTINNDNNTYENYVYYNNIPIRCNSSELTVTFDKEIIKLTENVDYVVSYQNCDTLNGDYSYGYITATGIGNYTGKITKSISIISKKFKSTSLSDFSITVTTPTITYSGTAKKATVKIVKKYYSSDKDTFEQKELCEGKDYVLSYANNVKIGQATVIINGIGDYTGYVKKTFNIIPGTVSGLAATPESTDSVKLKWNSLSEAQGYIIYKYDSAKKTWAKIKKTSVNNNSYTVTGLNAGTTYQFAIKAYKTVNEKEIKSSNYSTVKTSTKLKTVTNFKVNSVTDTKAVLSWNKVSGATGYIVYKYDSSKKGWIRIAKTTTTANSYTVNSLKSGTTYKFAVKGYKTIENKEISSISYPTISTVTYLGKVKDFHTGTVTSSSVQLSWTKLSNATGYIVYKYNSSTKKWERIIKTKTKNNSYTVSKLSGFTNYKFAVKGYKTINNKEIISVSYPSLSVRTGLAKIESFRVSSATNNSLKLSWKALKGAQKYEIYRKSNGKFIRITTITDTSYTVKNLKSGSTCTFKIKALHKDNNKTIYSPTSSCTAKVIDTNPHIYKISKTTYIYDTKHNKIGTLYTGNMYSGQYYPAYYGYIVLDYRYSKVLIKDTDVKVQKNAKILRTAAIGQLGESIYGRAACGPTAVAILVNSEKGVKWKKDSLIRYCENYGLCTPSLSSNGMTNGSQLIALINRYSDGKYSAKSVIDNKKSPSSILKNQIDNGKRTMILTCYRGSSILSYPSCLHFVVVCGYEYINGTLYFYYADPYYENGGRTLMRASASLINASVNNTGYKTMISLN